MNRMETPQDITNTNHREATIRKHYPEFYAYLMQNYPNVSWMEKCYMYYNNISSTPICPVCGKPVKFLSLFRGYSTHCSPKCTANDQKVRSKIEQTCTQKFGSTSPLHSNSSIRKDIEEIIANKYNGLGNGSCEIKSKTSKTCLERYGTESPFQSQKIQQHAQNTTINKYGGLGFAAPEILYKTSKTNLERYGAENYTQSNSYKQLYNHKQLDNHPDIISIDGDIYTCKCPHPGCNRCPGRYVVPKSIYIHRANCGTEPCTVLLPISEITKDTTIELFVQNILNKHNIKYTTQDSTILPGKIVDIYIPSHRVIIECNGIYWHSDKFKSKTEHITRMGLARNNGYQMIIIWEDWIKNSPTIVESLILSKLGIYSKRIYARQCKIYRISSKTYSNFLKYHIQGSCSNPIRYGLFYEDRLVAVMGFCKKRRGMMGSNIRDDSYELARFCCEPGLQIIGGAGKLLAHFIREFNPPKIVSFSSNDISTGNMYESLGFSKTAENNSYWYIDSKFNRYHRYKFRKSKLVSMGYNKDLTEFTITDSMGLYRIWDSGQIRWEMCL